jgi:spore coat polysaccharide biosynthesis protein SpsF
MGSSRLPGKTLIDLAGQTALARVLRRAGRARLVNQLVVATSNLRDDDPVADECRRLGVAAFRGSEQDVLERFRGAASAFGSDVAVRITADCPLIDGYLIDQVISGFLDCLPDYAANTLERTYPRGLDCEAIGMDALERAAAEAVKDYQRIHVTPYLYENPDRFRLVSITGEEDHSRHRWTLDTPEDLALVRAIYKRFDGSDDFSWRDVLRLVDQSPELSELNLGVRHKPLEAG